ncbi:hypothetical protein EZV62_026812 [Acer yangbiense]|uniref:Peptidase C1A papain C-terminal domain-containing protein n=1 Tax=Acer yangbiense TaxID=1000413 RepID=A0A5C7GS22_9ROSI|nr:hypothetical protein EZV62_026812 [Acer yangbiense]
MWIAIVVSVTNPIQPSLGYYEVKSNWNVCDFLCSGYGRAKIPHDRPPRLLLIYPSVQQMVDCDRGSYDCKRSLLGIAVAALEGVIKIKIGQLLGLFVQQLVYCDRGSYSCKSDFIHTAFEYVIENGIATDSSYSYKGLKGKCDQKKAINIATTIRSYTQITPCNERELLTAIL